MKVLNFLRQKYLCDNFELTKMKNYEKFINIKVF